MVERVSDFNMPEKIVTRLLKDALPDNVVISKDARNAACRSACIFILQLSIAAAEKAQMNKRRTLDNQDIIKAVKDLGLGEYAPQLVRFGAQRKRNAKRRESNIHKSKIRKPFQDGEVTQDTSSSPDPDMDEDLALESRQELQSQDEDELQREG